MLPRNIDLYDKNTGQFQWPGPMVRAGTERHSSAKINKQICA
jgi:hypothetical protein